MTTIEDVENLTIKTLHSVLLPLKKPRILKKYVDIALDFEFTENKLLSIQFALTKDKTKIYYWHKPSISSVELLTLVLDFLQGEIKQKNIYLIVHFGQAELSKINDWHINARFNQFNKAIAWRKSFTIDEDGKIVEFIFEYDKKPDYTLFINDLYGHFKTKLETVGNSLGIPKISLEKDGKPRNYYIEHMDELLEVDKELFEKYALRDVEITIEAWRKLKEHYEPYGVDVHIYPTFSGIAFASFRRIMKKLPCKTRTVYLLSKYKRKAGWISRIVKKRIYDDDLNIRYMAHLTYWGGRNEAFLRGYMKDIKAKFWDFISLYIISGILQPLPNEDTTWQKLQVENLDAFEGFCRVDFEFSKETMYPCLPVKTGFYQKLLFPLKGISYCTLRELRQAIKLGCKVNVFEGVGFEVTENEINHELANFLKSMLKEKNLSVKGSLEYELAKNRMVGVIGRLNFFKPKYTAEALYGFMRKYNVTEERFRELGSKKVMRELYSERGGGAGSSYHPEWASLILGNARSYAAQVIQYNCALISTDGGIWIGDSKLDETELHREMQRYGSGLRFEGDIDELWINSNRRYICWNKGEVVHAARMGIGMPEQDYIKVIRESIENGKPTIEKFKGKRLTNVHDFVFYDTPLNTAEIDKETKINWTWDNKRKLDNEINQFKDYAWSKPFNDIYEASKLEIAKTQPITKIGRPRLKLTDEQIAEIVKSDDTVRLLAKKYGVTSSYISKLKQHA